jgi:hypothetical protein
LIVSAQGRILSPYLVNPGGRVSAKNDPAAGVPLFKDTNKMTKRRGRARRLSAAEYGKKYIV